MTCHYPSAKTSRTSGSGSTNSTCVTDIVTYRYDGELAYVPVEPNYNQAISHARDAFPQLRNLGDSSFSLSLTVSGQKHKPIWISAPAWPKLVTHMQRYQIIDVHTSRQKDSAASSIPEITITYADTVDDAKQTDPAPPYQGPEVMIDEKAADEKPPCRRRTLSGSTLQSAKRNWLFQKLQGH